MCSESYVVRAGARVGAAALLALSLAACRGGSTIPSSSMGADVQPAGSQLGGQPAGGVMAHVLTGDYFGSIYISHRLQGATSIPPKIAAKYLNWAELRSSDDVSKLKAVGITTMLYFDATVVENDSPLITDKDSTFAQTCSHQRIDTKVEGALDYLMSRNSAEAQVASAYIAQARKSGYDAVFEDSAGVLPFMFRNEKPCHFVGSDWIKADADLETKIGGPLVPSSLDAYTESGGTWQQNIQSEALAVRPTSIGGLEEECYTSDSNPSVYKISNSLWVAEEDTQLFMNSRNKMFFCYERNQIEASSHDGLNYRLYDDASFLMAFDPAHDILWETFTTPSEFHVFPESGIVALNPLVAAPTSISKLQQGGAYVREYASCYYRGKPLGACAAVVNPSSFSTVSNPLFGKYAHTLVLHGAGVLDGGTATFTGPPPPKRLTAETAYVAVK